MTETATLTAETPTFTISSRVSDQAITAIVEQVYRHFGGRDWLIDLDRIMPGAGSRYFVPGNWEAYASAVVATLMEQLPDPIRHGNFFSDGIDLGDLRARFDEFDALPKEWWQEGYPMSEFFRKHSDEFAELSAFFKKYGQEAKQLGLSILYDEYCLEDLAFWYLRNEYDIDLDDFPLILRDAIDDERLHQSFFQRYCLPVELNGQDLILTSDLASHRR